MHRKVLLDLKKNTMKKIVLGIFGAAALALTSCGGAVDYSGAADAMCKCMAEKDAEEKGEFDLGRDVDYSFCALDVIIEHSVDITEEGFGTALNEKCSDLNDLHKEYISTSAE